MEESTNPDREFEEAWYSGEGSSPTRCQQQRPVGDVIEPSSARGIVGGISPGVWTGESIRDLEQAYCQEANRLVRTRLLGGVGGVRSNAAPIPILRCWVPSSGL